MDFFDLLDRVFRGIVFFIYDVVETTASIVRHPIKGPIQLYRMHTRPEKRQIVGLTFLFLWFLVLQWMLLPPIRDRLRQFHRIAESVDKRSSNAPTLDLNAIWPTVLAALVATVIIDAALRLSLRWPRSRRPGRRDMLLATSEYALVWMVFAKLVTTVFVPLFAQSGWTHLGGIVHYAWGPITLICSSYPAATLLERACRRQHSNLLRRVTAKSAIMALLTALFTLATFAGLKAERKVHNRRDYEKLMSSPTHVRTLRCVILPDGRVDVDALIYVEHGEPQAFDDLDDFRLSVLSKRSGMRDVLQQVRWRQPNQTSFVVVSQGQPALLELRTKLPIDVPPDGFCRLDAWLAASDGQPQQFGRLCGTSIYWATACPSARQDPKAGAER